VVSAPDSKAAQVLKRKEELAELRTHYSDQYPEVIRVKAEIAALEREVATNGASHAAGEPTVNPTIRFTRQGLESVERELRSLKEEEASLRKQIAVYEARVDGAPARQEALQQPTADYETVNERYQALLKRSEEAQLAENLERGHNTEQFRILDPALPAVHPAAPNRLWLLAMGLVASLAIGLGAIVAVERLDATFHTVDDLQAFTNLPTLARIRRIPTAATARRRRVRLALTACAVIVGLAVIVAGSYYVAGGNEQLVRMTARPSL